MAKGFKAPADPRGGHLRLYWDVFDSNAWASLGGSDQLAYLAVLRQKKSTNNGDLSLPISVARKFGIKSETTLAKSLRALCAVGLLAVTREGGSTKGGQRLPTLYRLTDYEAFEITAKHVDACKATNEWKAIRTIAMGADAIRHAEVLASTKALAKKTKTLLQNLESTTPKNEAIGSKTTSKNGVWPLEPLQKMELEKTS